MNCPEYTAFVPFPFGSQEFCGAGWRQKEASGRAGGVRVSRRHVSHHLVQLGGELSFSSSWICPDFLSLLPKTEGGDV